MNLCLVSTKNTSHSYPSFKHWHDTSKNYAFSEILFCGAKELRTQLEKTASIYYQMVTKGIEFDPEKLKQNETDSLMKKAYFFEKKLLEINHLITEK